MQHAGLNAVPIVVLLKFLVSALIRVRDLNNTCGTNTIPMDLDLDVVPGDINASNRFEACELLSRSDAASAAAKHNE